MSKTINRYIVKHMGNGKYISAFSLPPGKSKLCSNIESAYKFHDKEWIREKLRYYGDSNMYEIIEIKMETPKPTEKYRHFNHHHELDEKHKIVDFGDGEFIANIEAIELLKALNEIGLRTRTHHISDEHNHAFISILLDNVSLEIRDVNEVHASREKYNGKKELLIKWLRK